MRRAWGIATRAGFILALGAIVACSDGAAGPDAGPDAVGGDLPDAGGIDATMVDASLDAGVDAMTGDIDLTQSSSMSVESNRSAACGLDHDSSSATPIITNENSYYRVFDLPAEGYGGQVTISEVQFGVQVADAPQGSQWVQLRLSSLVGGFQTGNMTLRRSADLLIFDQQQSLLTVTFSPAVVFEAGSKLVVEIYVPDSTDDGSGEHNVFFIGANADPETAPSYARAPACGVEQPETFAALAFPDTHLVMRVIGTSP
jgi:hypothetical protein